MPLARSIQRSRKAATSAGEPMQTYSRMRNDWKRSAWWDGSRRKQSLATSKRAPPAGSAPALRHDGIDRVAGGRRQHEVAGVERLRPVAALLEGLDRGADVVIVPPSAHMQPSRLGKLLR